MACWSAWAKTDDPSFHQYEAMPQLAPPSSDLKRSMPPAHTRFGLTGSTARTLSYHPWPSRKSPLPRPHSTRESSIGLVSSSVFNLVGLVSVTRGNQVPPPSVDRYTAVSSPVM